VHLDGLLRRAELGGDLLVAPPRHDKAQHLVLAWRECRIALLKGALTRPVLPGKLVDMQRFGHGRDQLEVLHRLGEQGHGPRLHGAHAHRNVGAARQKDDRKRATRCTHRGLQLEAVDLRHDDVE
jgi:hypothetical protein